MPRKRKPQHIKDLEGDHHKGRQNPDKPEAEAYKPQPPEWLTDRAKRYFREFATDLFNLGVITRPDRYELAMLASLYDQYVSTQEDIQKEGHTWQEIDTAGNPKEKVNPKMSVSLQLAKQVSSLLADFGLSPSDRESVSKASNKQKGSGDPLEGYLKN